MDGVQTPPQPAFAIGDDNACRMHSGIAREAFERFRVLEELFRLRLGMHTNQVVSTAAIGNKRREVARILTVLKAKA